MCVNRAVFFDRDGILNRIVMRGNKVGSPRSVEEVKFMEGAERLVELAKSRGYLTIMITNQPDVGRGFLERAELERIHDFLNEKYRLDGIEVCCSGDDSDPRRKPNPGMLLDAAVQHRVDLQSSFFIGDSVKDLEAGKRAGVKTILLQTEYNLEYHGQGDFNCNSVNDALSIVGTEFTLSLIHI